MSIWKDVLTSIVTDSWLNLSTGSGSATSDKTKNITFQKNVKISDEELENRFNGDIDSYKICTMIVDHAFRQGIEIIAPPDISPETKTSGTMALQNEMKRHKALKKLRYAAILGRLFGGAAVIIRVNDGQFDDLPINYERIEKVSYLKVEDKRRLMPYQWYTDPEPNFDEVEIYQYNPLRPQDNSQIYLHESRMLVFTGAVTTEQGIIENSYWPYSVLERINDTVKRSKNIMSSVGQMMTDVSQGVLKIHNFWEIISGRNTDEFMTRMKAMDMSRSVGRTIPIDTVEDFHYEDRSFSGVPDIVEKSMMDMSSATGIPVTVYYGKSPDGMNATGELDIRNWYDQVESERVEEYSENVQETIKIFAYALDLERPEEWSFKWNSLWQMTKPEKAEHMEKVSRSDKVYMDAGVLDPNEVRMQRFGTDEYSDTPPTVTAPLNATSSDDGQDETDLDEMNQDGFVMDAKDFVTILFDTLRLFVRLSAPKELVKRISAMIAEKLGIHDQDVMVALETSDLEWVPELFRTDGVSTVVEPLVVNDIKALRNLAKVSAPQEVLRRLVNRISSALGINDLEMKETIDQYEFSLSTISDREQFREDIFELSQKLNSIMSRM